MKTAVGRSGVGVDFGLSACDCYKGKTTEKSRVKARSVTVVRFRSINAAGGRSAGRRKRRKPATWYYLEREKRGGDKLGSGDKQRNDMTSRVADGGSDGWRMFEEEPCRALRLEPRPAS